VEAVAEFQATLSCACCSAHVCHTALAVLRVFRVLRMIYRRQQPQRGQPRTSHSSPVRSISVQFGGPAHAELATGPLVLSRTPLPGEAASRLSMVAAWLKMAVERFTEWR
jgi:hypothetical protein